MSLSAPKNAPKNVPRENASGSGAVADLKLAAMLLALAGAVDAIGFLKLGGLFVSFMSGDSTQTAAALVLHDDGKVALGLALVGLFTGGAFLGGLVGWATSPRTRRAVLLGLVAGLLLAGCVAGHEGRTGFGVSLMVLAMGLTNAVLHHAGSTSIGLTYVTGTLARLGEGLARAATRQAGLEAWAPYLLMWLALIAGAASGTAIYARFGFDALLAPGLLTAVLALAQAFQTRRIAPAVAPSKVAPPPEARRGPWDRTP